MTVAWVSNTQVSDKLCCFIQAKLVLLIFGDLLNRRGDVLH